MIINNKPNNNLVNSVNCTCILIKATKLKHGQKLILDTSFQWLLIYHGGADLYPLPPLSMIVIPLKPQNHLQFSDLHVVSRDSQCALPVRRIVPRGFWRSAWGSGAIRRCLQIRSDSEGALTTRDTLKKLHLEINLLSLDGVQF